MRVKEIRLTIEAVLSELGYDGGLWAWRDRLAHLKRAVSLLTKQRDAHAETIKELRAKIEDLENADFEGACGCECGDFEECWDKAREYEDRVQELAQIYTRMSDNPKDARERLARVLDEIDNCWRAFA